MLRVRAVFTGFQGLPGVSTWFFNGSSQSEADEAAGAVSAFYSAIADQFSVPLIISIDDVVDQVNSLTGDNTEFYAVDVPDVAGSAVSEPLPFAVQGLVRFRTTSVRNSRRVSGRTFLPCMYIGASEDGILNSPNQGAITTAAEGTVGDMSAENYHVVWSRPSLSVPGASSPVTSYDTAENFAVLTTRRD